MKQKLDLVVEPRQVGKGNSRQLRTEKKIPAVIYGAINPTNVFIHENDVKKYNTRQYENALFTLQSSDKTANGKVVLIKTVDVNPLSRRPTHVDLFALDLTKAIRVNIEVRLEGKPVGLAEGGLLNVANRQVEVECLPNAIPEFFTLDVSHLNVGESVHASDIKLPKDVKLISKSEETIASVVVAEEEVAATPAAAPAAATPAAAPAAAAAKK